MNRDFSKYIEFRLSEWADWFSRDNHYGLGYPSRSMEYRLMTEGAIPRNKYVNQFLACNEEAEEIERLVKEMSEYNSNMALALRCYYFTSGGLRVKAKKVAISHMHFKYYVDMAHQWLAGRLSYIKNIKKIKNFKLKNTCIVNTNHV